MFSGSYTETIGFSKATSTCTGVSDILNGFNIGFWCHYSTGDGSVIMIGGGGGTCNRADHGIAITEENSPMLGGTLPKFDFGDEANISPTTSYALNLWVY